MTASFPRVETDPVSGPELDALEADVAALEASLEAEIAARLPLAGGTLSGSLILAGDPTSNLEAVPRQYVASQIAALINGAPSTLDTLNEIATQLGNDESAVAALTATVAGKLSAAANLSDLANAVTARANLGLGTAATKDSGAAGQAGKVLAADDASTSNARTPTAHKSSHATGGSDVLSPADIAALAAAARGAASGVASLDANQKVNEARADGAILLRELSDAARASWLPGGAIAETMPRNFCQSQLTMTTGRLWLAGGIVIPGGRLVTSISVPAGTAGSGLTHTWFCLVDRAGNVIRKTADDTSATWPGPGVAGNVKTLNLATTYTPSSSIEVYVGVVEVGTTPASLWRLGGGLGSAIGTGGGLGDSANTGLTDPASLGATISAVPPGHNPFYAFIS